MNYTNFKIKLFCVEKNVDKPMSILGLLTNAVQKKAHKLCNKGLRLSVNVL
jgi:hypothetical protein